MVSSSAPLLIVIAGPTASGKTALGMKLAQHFKTEIISADSRQCYRELNIGVAKPTQAEMQGVPHSFIDSHSITEEVNAGSFEKYALQAAHEIFAHHSIAILVGGTGLYIKAICEGIDDMPTVLPAVRLAINEQYRQQGLSWLQKELAEKDPDFWQSTREPQNPQRLIRALEIKQSTGQSILHFRSGKIIRRPFSILKFALQWPRDQLYARIEQRVDSMIAAGLEEEVRSLLPYRQYNALQTVGYREFFDYFDGKISREQAIRNLKTNTRQYAKRQITWLKKDTSYRWISPDDIPTILEETDKFL